MSANWANDPTKSYTTPKREIVGDNATFTYSTDKERIAELEAENRALWRFIDAADALADFNSTVKVSDAGGYEQWRARSESLNNELGDATADLQRYNASRQRLATEYGLPLPGEEAGS